MIIIPSYLNPDAPEREKLVLVITILELERARRRGEIVMRFREAKGGTRVTLLDSALKYRDLGFSVIPVRPNKKPFIKWEQYQKKHPNQHEIRRWDHNGFREYPLEEALKLKEIFSLRK